MSSGGMITTRVIYLPTFTTTRYEFYSTIAIIIEVVRLLVQNFCCLRISVVCVSELHIGTALCTHL